MSRLFTNKREQATHKIDEITNEAFGSVDNYVLPVRRTILQRFPVVFALLVTTGSTAMFLGIEQIILKYKIFANQPELILLFGVVILAFTGKLYKKLG